MNLDRDVTVEPRAVGLLRSVVSGSGPPGEGLPRPRGPISVNGRRLAIDDRDCVAGVPERVLLQHGSDGLVSRTWASSSETSADLSPGVVEADGLPAVLPDDAETGDPADDGPDGAADPLEPVRPRPAGHQRQRRRPQSFDCPNDTPRSQTVDSNTRTTRRWVSRRTRDTHLSGLPSDRLRRCRGSRHAVRLAGRAGVDPDLG